MNASRLRIGHRAPRASRSRVVGTTAWAFIGVASVFGSCSTILNWEESNLLCDEDRNCKDGYSCLGERCIGDHSVELGGTCLTDLQCSSEYTCGREPATCRIACTEYYKAYEDGCKATEYCKAVLDTNKSVKGMCQPSDDCTYEPCSDARLCINEVKPGVSACAVNCDEGSTGLKYAAYECP